MRSAPRRSQLALLLAALLRHALGAGAAKSGEGPCSAQDWADSKRSFWAVVGDGSEARRRLEAFRRMPAPPALRPSACLQGAASLHLLHLLHGPRSELLGELEERGSELLAVLLGSSWLEVAEGGWPLFGLLHLAAAEFGAPAAAGTGAALGAGACGEAGRGAAGAPWQPIRSDDHVHFRNWLCSHLEHGQTPPLADSVHFLARADPRAPEDEARGCSAAKAMGYLAAALAFAEEADVATRAEAKELVHSAEVHVKHCAEVDPGSFSLVSLLSTEWPLWWLLHSVLARLHPPRAEAGAPRRPDGAPARAPASPPDSREQVRMPKSCGEAAGTAGRPFACELPLAVRQRFHDLGGGFHVLEVVRLEEALALRPGSFVQLFREGSPLRRASRAEAAGALAPPPPGTPPFWFEAGLWGGGAVCVYDPGFRSPGAAYAASAAQPVAVGLYAEAGSAGDPYNAEWLRAYLAAFARLGLPVHRISRPEEAQAGVLYFWRINQMFAGGRLAGAAGVGAAVAAHLEELRARGAALWPRPETMRFYQDKLALRGLFQQAGVPAPRSWVVASLADFAELLAGGNLTAESFPLVLKHPYAASSRGMVACDSLAEAEALLAAWLAEHRSPCLLQERLHISRDLRVTYVGGEIVHGYWRLKGSAGDLTSGTSATGSRLDFRIPAAELAPFVRDFAARTGIDIGGMDIAFPDSGGPVVFEVSPIFDLNPEPPAEWAQRPYREYKQTQDYANQRAQSYTACAEQIVTYAANHRAQLFVDIDNTVNNAWERIRRAALPQWPGESFDAARAFAAAELLQDQPLPGAASSLARLSQDWEVSFLSARGYAGSFEPTVQWLKEHGFTCTRVILVSEARDKVAWLEDAAGAPFRGGRRVLLVDDFTRGHHLKAPEADEELVRALQVRGIPFEVFRPEVTSWPEVAKHLTVVIKSIPRAQAHGWST